MNISWKADEKSRVNKNVEGWVSGMDRRVISERDLVRGRVLVSACAVIEGKGHEILFIREADVPYHEWWVVPGGYVNPTETVKEAVVREVKEETGLNIIPMRLIGVYDDFLSAQDQPLHHIIIAYEGRVVHGRLIFSPEAMTYAWLSVDQAVSSQVPDVFKAVVKDYEKQRSAGLMSGFKRRVLRNRKE